MRARLLFLVALGLAVPHPVVAAPATPAAADDAKLARDHFERGARLFDVGKFAEAAVEFEAAYQIKPDPNFLFNLAQCRRRLGQYDEALRLYRTYVKRERSASRRREVERIIDEVEVQRNEETAARARASTPPPAPAPDLAATDPTLTAAAPAPDAPSWYGNPWVWGAAGAVIIGAVVVAIVASSGGSNGLPTGFCGECNAGPFPVPARP